MQRNILAITASLYVFRSYYLRQIVSSIVAQWLERQTSYRKVTDSMLVLGIMLLCCCKKHLTLIFLQVPNTM